MRATRTVQKILANYESDNPGVKANLCRILMNGKLGGTGKMIILPVDQGFEHGPARSFAPNPGGYDPHYHYQLAIPKILSTLGPDVKILILLRNPVARAYSAYMHFFKDCFEESSFEEALEMEYYRKEQHWDFMWHYQAMGMYYEQVKAYTDAFENVHVLYFEELVKAPEQFMHKVFRVLGLEPLAKLETGTTNPSGQPRFPWLQRVITHENMAKRMLRPLVRSVFRNDARRAEMRKSLKAKNLRSYPAMQPETNARLRAHYATDVHNLSELLGKNLTQWVNP